MEICLITNFFNKFLDNIYIHIVLFINKDYKNYTNEKRRITR